MSRRQRTILTLSVRIRVPAGYTQKRVMEELDKYIHAVPNSSYAKSEIQVKLEGKETTYY